MTHEEEVYVARAALAGVRFEVFDHGVSKMWRWTMPDGTVHKHGMYTIVRAAVKALNELGEISTNEMQMYINRTNNMAHQDHYRVWSDTPQQAEELTQHEHDDCTNTTIEPDQL